jgi:flotillin
VISQLPELVRVAEQGLQGANVTVLNGAQGLNEAVAARAAQGATILHTLLEGLGDRRDGGGRSAANGHPGSLPERARLDG